VRPLLPLLRRILFASQRLSLLLLRILRYKTFFLSYRSYKWYRARFRRNLVSSAFGPRRSGRSSLRAGGFYGFRLRALPYGGCASYALRARIVGTPTIHLASAAFGSLLLPVFNRISFLHNGFRLRALPYGSCASYALRARKVGTPTFHLASSRVPSGRCFCWYCTTLALCCYSAFIGCGP
jgi:hypothetical protein